MSSNQVMECPICLDNIDTTKNCVTTECGHTFHASCLLSSVAHSNFACPCCRYELAEQPEDSDDGYSDDDDEEEVDDDEIYQNMRWLFQRAEGEELEEEEELDDDDDELDEEEVRDVPINYIVDNLRGLNYNFEDIVKVLVNDFLFKDQDERSIHILDALEGLIERYDETTTEVVPVAPVTTVEEKKGSQIGWCLRHRMTADLCGNN